MRTASPSVELAAKILSAYVTRNNVPADVLPELLLQVHRSIATLGRPSTTSIDRPTDAQIRASIRPDSLISFEDGKPYKTLRRHLTIRGLSPETYREKYGLPADYPMTSVSYSAQRSQLAKDLGLGTQRNNVSKAATAKKR